MKRTDQTGQPEGDPAPGGGEAASAESDGMTLPAGPGEALVLAVNPQLRQQLSAAGWQVRAVPIPGGDLTGFAVAAAAASADLIVIDDALSPLHHADKRTVLAVTLKWLRPGGSLLLREPLEPTWAGSRGGVRRAWHRLLHGRIDPHYGPASTPFWRDAAQHAGFDHLETAEVAGRLILRATRRASAHPADSDRAHPHR